MKDDLEEKVAKIFMDASNYDNAVPDYMETGIDPLTVDSMLKLCEDAIRKSKDIEVRWDLHIADFVRLRDAAKRKEAKEVFGISDNPVSYGYPWSISIVVVDDLEKGWMRAHFGDGRVEERTFDIFEAFGTRFRFYRVNGVETVRVLEEG